MFLYYYFLFSHPPYWKRLDNNTVKRLPSVDSDQDDDVLQIDIDVEENFDSCCDDGELQESPPLQSPAIYYSYISPESVDEKDSRQSHTVGLGTGAPVATKVVPIGTPLWNQSSVMVISHILALLKKNNLALVSKDVPYEQQAGLCYELIRTGKCAANSKPNQTCSFNHCINIEVISGYTHHLCHTKSTLGPLTCCSVWQVMNHPGTSILKAKWAYRSLEPLSMPC